MTLGDDEVEDIEFSDTPEPARKGRPPGAKNKVASDKAPKGIKPPKVSWPEEAGVIRSLTTSLEAIGLGVGLLNKVDGESIIAGAPGLVEAMVNLGRDDKRMRKYLEAMSAPGKYGPIIMATGSILLPIAANHGLFEGFGKKKSDNLETTVDANITWEA